MSDGLAIWKQVEKTDPRATKKITGKAFGGTAIKPMYLIKRATELWGPMGHRWGLTVLDQRVVECGPTDRLHVVLAEVFYPTEGGGRGAVPCFGQTHLCGARKSGEFFLDEDAPKKSLTDALTKGLSWLGFAADVHMGRFDDVKYLAENTRDFEEQERQEQAADARERHEKMKKEAAAVLDGAAKQGTRALQTAWQALSQAQRQAVADAGGGCPDVYKRAAAEADKSNHKEAAHARN